MPRHAYVAAFRIPLVLLFAALIVLPAQGAALADALEISRPARPWELLCSTGTRAAILGNESGNVEAWVYPLKLLRDFRLQFLLRGRVLAAEPLARTVTVRPEATTVLYAYDTFQVRETFFVPVKEPGAVIALEIETAEPLQIEASFVPDFTLEWPAALGATFVSWDQELNAFVFGEERKKYHAIVGSPGATLAGEAYATNFTASNRNAMRLGEVTPGRATKVIAIAAALDGRGNAEASYRRLLSSYSELLAGSRQYYRDYLDRTTSVSLPDERLQQAYDWARISVVQGMVSNPMLGTGLVAGYRISGESQRPGFAWFFGRDAEWTSLALDAEGDFESTRRALDFLARYQRADGRVPHEIAQTASLVNWFSDFPYAWASADATPLFIVAIGEYVRRSGDVAFAQQHWDNLWRAYGFVRSTWDAHGFAKNIGVGHGWIEGGPLRRAEQGAPARQPPGLSASKVIKSELYQAAAGIEALQNLSGLARLTGHAALVAEFDGQEARQRAAMNAMFWDPASGTYAFALDPEDRRIDVPSVLAAVPMWFGLLDESHAERMLSTLSDADFATDWGTRILSSRDPRYDPGGYHYGSVWPLFTGWTSVGAYRYHRAATGYAALLANAELAHSGSPGHVTEVLSGDYAQELSTSSPHQIWSSAMVISPLLLGLLGLDVNVPGHTVSLSPHVPAGGERLTVYRVHAGAAELNIEYSRHEGEIHATIRRSGPGEITLRFAPAISVRAQLANATVNGRPANFHLQRTASDQHAVVQVPLAGGATEIRLALRDDFDIVMPWFAPGLGQSSHNLKILSEAWSADHATLALTMAGVGGHSYELRLRGARALQSVRGGTLVKTSAENAVLRVSVAPADGKYHHVSSTLVFAGAANATFHSRPRPQGYAARSNQCTRSP
jgi:glycogen debranching enzyme